MSHVLEIRDLSVTFRQDGHAIRAVRNVSFSVGRGETVAIVGESGSGKSVTALASVGLLPDSAQVDGSIRYDGTEMVGAPEPTLRKVRGNDISFIFQEPMTSLNPLHNIEKQIAEALFVHQGIRPRPLGKRLVEWMGNRRPLRPLIWLGVLGLLISLYRVLIAWGERSDDVTITPLAYFMLFIDTLWWWIQAGVVVSAITFFLVGIARQPRLADWARRSPSRDAALGLLERVGIPDPESRIGALPHQLSGGQRQRVMIAMALANKPQLLIADEPTTALDVTIQAQVLDLLDTLKRDTGMSMLFITHDLGIVRRIADRVCVMQGGVLVEEGAVQEIFDAPKHPYTQKLLAAEPRGQPHPLHANAREIVRTDGLRVWFPIQRGFLRSTVGHVKAVNDMTLSVRAGETLGIVGESGSGKTTVALAILRLLGSTGTIALQGRDIQGLSPGAVRPLRRDMQIVFQDPYGSLSPRMTVEQIIAEGLGVHGVPEGQNSTGLVAQMMTEVGLDPATMARYPHEFSGGQRQRIAIARAMILRPRLVVLDEPTSALDMTVQVQIVDLLRDLQRRYDLAYIFISHDLRVVRALAHKVIVMKAGDVVEAGSAEQIFTNPQADYTRGLLKAAFHAPQPDPVM